MDRSVLLVGVIIIAAMLLVPPFEPGAVDQIGDVLKGEKARAVTYAPIWSESADIAWKRLGLQILAVSLGAVGISYYRHS